MLTLAFDTATSVATSALVDDGETLGERVGLAGRLFEDVDELFNGADVQPTALLMLSKKLSGAVASFAYMFAPWANSLGGTG